MLSTANGCGGTHPGEASTAPARKSWPASASAPSGGCSSYGARLWDGQRDGSWAARHAWPDQPWGDDQRLAVTRGGLYQCFRAYCEAEGLGRKVPTASWFGTAMGGFGFQRAKVTDGDRKRHNVYLLDADQLRAALRDSAGLEAASHADMERLLA